jgi:hypothetical protein
MLPDSGRLSASHTKSRKTKKKERGVASLPLLVNPGEGTMEGFPSDE